MTRGYDHARIQEYWRHVWEREGVFECPDDAEDPTYVLGMFPYTSGSLHMGHVRNYAITDAYARYRRLCGDDVLHPMGWDAFGLPAENAAYERETDPESWTRTCIERMRADLEEMGFGYDWSREITTCDPEYYRWNQWLFTRLYDAGLVERKAATVNWCPDCETVLADAQVEVTDGEVADGEVADGRDTDAVEERVGEHTHDRAGGGAGRPAPAAARGAGVCWRCETPVERRELDQWFFSITDYAEELHAGLDDLDGWPEGVREIQRNWIGRREGARITFEVAGDGAGVGDGAETVAESESVDVFTTRPDTVYGATYVALSPGHDLAAAIAETDETVAEYVESVDDPTDAGYAGVETDLRAVHPLTGEELPVYVAAYVLDDVGTGAVMGVPAHNERDHAFASEQGLPIRQVVEPTGGADGEDARDDAEAVDVEDEPYTGEGTLTNSGEYDGLASAAAKERLLGEEAVESAVTYRLRDWLISRQRYWGTPIPIVHCEECGPVPVPDEDLPVELPAYVQTRGNPLAASEEFLETACPDCGRPARRETDTMDTFVDSSWYFLRYLSPDLEAAPFDSTLAEEWLPVDVYVGGEEHAVLHLLYIRFFTRALADLDLLDVREPVDRLVNQGTVLHGGEKMSKSKGNAIAPHEYGAETTRLFVLASAHPTQDFEWTATDVDAVYDFQQTVYELVADFVERSDLRHQSTDHDAYLEREVDRTIAAVTEEYERFRFHRVVSELQAFVRTLRRYRAHEPPYKYAYGRALRSLVGLLAPVAPYLAEECWHLFDEDGPVAATRWPEPLRDVDDYRVERGLVRSTLDDVREITQVVDIADPETIEIAVAPEWQFRAYELARAADPDEAVVGTILEDPLVREHREAAGEFAADLQERQAGLAPVLDPEREGAVLREAAWLFADEFGAAVTVRQAQPGEEMADRAEPGRPAIHVR